MPTHSEELEGFRKALEEHIKPVAEKFGLSFTKVGVTLYAVVAPSFSFKFYCMGGHGCSFTVTVAPTFRPFWNEPDERGFPWLAKYVGRHTWEHSRHADLQGLAQDLAVLAAILPEYIGLLGMATPSYWEGFHSFVAAEIARRPTPEWMKRYDETNAT